jgi:glutathionylspermidine synthase
MRFQPLALTPSEFAGRLERLRFDYSKWDLHVGGRSTIPNGALVLERTEHQRLVRLSEDLAAAFVRARERLRKDPEAWRQLGLQPEVAAAAAQETGPQDLVTRIDFFPTAEGWRVSECNDDCPGGYNEAIGLPAVLDDALPEKTAVAGALRDDLLGFVERNLGPEGPVALLYATGYAEDLQVVHVLRRLLQERGVQTVAASPAHASFDDRPRVLGQEVGGLFRFFPTEWLPRLPNWGDWRRLTRAGVPLLNPLSSAFTQSKASAAWLWDNDPERVVRDVLPATRLLDAQAAAEALEAPQDHVLKPAFGRMGEGVTMGAECPPTAWRKRVKAALRDQRMRPYVLQRRFHSVPVETQPGTTYTACLGAYVVAGRFAGYYSRLARGSLVAYDAANVLTVVETA